MSEVIVITSGKGGVGTGKEGACDRYGSGTS